jgi:hypothetical protein
MRRRFPSWKIHHSLSRDMVEWRPAVRTVGKLDQMWLLLSVFLPGTIFGLVDTGCVAAIVACTI